MKIKLLAVAILLACASLAYAAQQTFFVQIVNTKNQTTAESMKNKLGRFGKAYIHKKGDRFAVRIGPISNGQEAVRIRDRVKEIYPDAFIGKSDSESSASVVAKPKAAVKPKSTEAVVVPVAPSTPLPAVAPKNRDVQPGTAVETAASPAALSAPDALLKEAVDHYRFHRNENAIQQFSLFLSLYPGHNHAPSAMLALAGIFLEMKRPMSALRIYSKIIDRYAGTPEVIDSITALADMRILSPDLKPPISVNGAEWYRDPVSAYDMVLSKNPPAEIAERLNFQRIIAFRSMKRLQSAYDAGKQFLIRYPRTMHRPALIAALRSDVATLIDEHIRTGDDLAALSMFTDARQKGMIAMTETEFLIRVAESYGHLGMPDEARALLIGAKPYAGGRTPQVETALASLEKAKPSPVPPPAATDRWAMYEAGREQVRSAKLQDAEKTFAQVKGSAQDIFWSRLADFAMEDNTWTVKYKDYLKK
jgi:TolA-binding protein